jgi:hypothetical protein
MTFPARAAVAANLVLAAALLPQTSLAAEPQAIADSLVAALEAGTKGQVSFGEASAEGDDVVISGLAFSDEDGETTVTFDRTVVVAPEERSEGGFEAEEIELTAGTISGQSTGSVESATITDVTVLSPEETAARQLSQGIVYSTAEAAGIRLTPPEQTGEIGIETIFIEVGDIVDDVPQASSGYVEGISVPGAMFGEGPMTPQALGYDDLQFEIRWEGGRDPATDELTVEDFTLTMLDGGSLTLTGKVGNLPFARIEDPTASADAASQVTIHNVTLEYVDESLTRRILDTMAQAQGMTGEQYGQQLAAALPFMLAAINNPAFQQQLAGALGAFLQDPQSLTIEIAPESPVTGAEIMQIVSTAPQTLPDRLNANVSANGAP